MGTSIEGTRRGMGPSTYARMTEIMSGRTISQLGLTTTSKDPATKVRTEASGGIWSDAGARTSDEGSVTASETTLEVVLLDGNAIGRQRSPGHSVAPSNAARNQTQSWTIAASISERGSMQTTRARGACVSALKPRPAWEGMLLENGMQSRGQNRTREIRPSGIVGGLAETWVWSELNGHVQRKRRNSQARACSCAHRKSIPTTACCV
jgi:hypothetical protein